MEAFEIIRATMNEFNEVPDDTVNMFLSLTEPLISKKRFGKMYQQARAYLAAHKMKLSGFGVSGDRGHHWISLCFRRRNIGVFF